MCWQGMTGCPPWRKRALHFTFWNPPVLRFNCSRALSRMMLIFQGKTYQFKPVKLKTFTYPLHERGPMGFLCWTMWKEVFAESMHEFLVFFTAHNGSREALILLELPHRLFIITARMVNCYWPSNMVMCSVFLLCWCIFLCSKQCLYWRDLA